MHESTDSIIAKRLVRNLQYRQTYIQVFEDFAASGFHPMMGKLLSSLVETQKAAVASLSTYLRGLGLDTGDPTVYSKLLQQAAQRKGTSSQLHFIHYSLTKSVSWYKMQLTDSQMTADQELQRLLIELGETDAASLWRTEAVMVMLRIRSEFAPKRPRERLPVEPDEEEGWRPRLLDPSTRPA